MSRRSSLPGQSGLPALAIALALATAGAACGLRTPVRPPEATAPIIPGVVTAEPGRDATVVRWRRAQRSADGQRLDDLTTFVVERRLEGEQQAWTPVGTIDVVDQEKIRRQRHFSWRDEEPVEGALYRVLAVCADGQQGPPVEAVVEASADAAQESPPDSPKDPSDTTPHPEPDPAP